MNWETSIGFLTALAALIASAVALYRASGEQQKNRADIANNTVAVAAELVDDLRQEIQRLRERIEYLESKASRQNEDIVRLSLEVAQSRERITALETENELLRDENKRLGGDCD